MPVGQAVMATSVRPSSSLALAPSGSSAGAFFGAPATTSVTNSTSSSLVAAPRNASMNSLRTRLRANLDRILRWALPAPSGAAIMNTKFAAPSGPPKSTGFFNRANAKVGSVTEADRQWGIATPPGTPVAAFDSRASTSLARPSASVARPASATTLARFVITSVVSEPKSTSSSTRSVEIIDESDIGIIPYSQAPTPTTNQDRGSINWMNELEGIGSEWL